MYQALLSIFMSGLVIGAAPLSAQESEDVKWTTFRGQKSLKMVTYCQRGSRYKQFYVLEMLIYQMYNLIRDDKDFNKKVIGKCRK